MVNYINRIVALRYFWWTLVRNDFRNRYRRSFLGIAWSLARPVGMTIILCLVFSRIFKDDNQDYAPFLFAGLAVWQFLSECILMGCGCFVEGSAYMRQQPIPVLIFPLRIVLVASIHLAISLVLALVLTAFFVGLPSLAVLLSLLPAIAYAFALGVCLATLAGLVHTHFSDTKHVLEIALQGLYFLTPVIYRPQMFDNRVRMSWFVVKYNPFNAVLELVRQPLLTGEYADPWNWQVAFLFLGIMAILAWWGLRKLEQNLVFWV